MRTTLPNAAASGRTTRMLMDAILRTKKGENGIIVATGANIPNLLQRGYALCVGMAIPAAKATDGSAITIMDGPKLEFRSDAADGWEWGRMQFKNSAADFTYVDHSAIASAFGPLLGHYHGWDEV